MRFSHDDRRLAALRPGVKRTAATRGGTGGKTQGDPLRPIRAYRNRLVHGRVVPEYQRTAVDSVGDPLGTTLFYPRIEHVNEFLDWREAFRIRALPGPGSAVVDSNPPSEFIEGALIVRDAWEQVIGYVEGEWRAHLLPSH
jgi:hypothetical protein